MLLTSNQTVSRILLGENRLVMMGLLANLSKNVHITRVRGQVGYIILFTNVNLVPCIEVAAVCVAANSLRILLPSQNLVQKVELGWTMQHIRRSANASLLPLY